MENISKQGRSYISHWFCQFGFWIVRPTSFQKSNKKAGKLQFLFFEVTLCDQTVSVWQFVAITSKCKSHEPLQFHVTKYNESQSLNITDAFQKRSYFDQYIAARMNEMKEPTCLLKTLSETSRPLKYSHS